MLDDNHLCRLETRKDEIAVGNEYTADMAIDPFGGDHMLSAETCRAIRLRPMGDVLDWREIHSPHEIGVFARMVATVVDGRTPLWPWRGPGEDQFPRSNRRPCRHMQLEDTGRRKWGRGKGGYSCRDGVVEVFYFLVVSLVIVETVSDTYSFSKPLGTAEVCPFLVTSHWIIVCHWIFVLRAVEEDEQ